jgi:two-component system NtrC family response regulator
MRRGAHDYICKPIDLKMLRLLVRSVREQHLLAEENLRSQNRLASPDDIPEMIGQSHMMGKLFEVIRQVAQTDVTVLLEGESGSGKELVARAIHGLSDRRGAPFVAANLAALPDSLIESELFGHEKGAFTGANRQKPGCFEMAQSGTLFLDEVADMPHKTQLDLLRVLEERELRRIGGEDLIALDVRLIAATHRRIDDRVAQGDFREDLYYRLNVVPIRVPPLRQRGEDIPLLVRHFLEKAERRHKKEPKKISGAAMRVLCDYTWPGNVRQLRNCMERLVVTIEGDVIHAEDLPEELRILPTQVFATMEDAVQQAERTSILAALSQCNQHRERAARLLGISVRTLHYKMSRYGL